MITGSAIYRQKDRDVKLLYYMKENRTGKEKQTLFFYLESIFVRLIVCYVVNDTGCVEENDEKYLL